MDQHLTTSPMVRAYVMRAHRLRAEMVGRMLHEAVASVRRGVEATDRRVRPAIKTATRAALHIMQEHGRRLRRRHRQHKALADLRRLDDRTLKDIGIPRSEIMWRVLVLDPIRDPRHETAAAARPHKTPVAPTDLVGKTAPGRPLAPPVAP